MTDTTSTTRRGALKTLAAGGAAAASLPLWARYTHAQTAEPIKIGFQVHSTGIGAAYGRWYDRTTTAAAALINEAGGINGRPIEIIAEDDGTDPRRGAEVIERFANQHGCDIAFGTLFSHGGEEFLFVLKGEINVHSAFYETVRLGQGDGVYLDSSMGHAYVSANGQDAEVLCICTEPKAQGEDAPAI